MKKVLVFVFFVLVCISFVAAGNNKTPISNLSYSEKNNSYSVNYLSKTRLQGEGNYFILFFTLLDSNHNVVKAPAYVDIRIVNSNGEEVYNETKTIRSSDYAVWTSKADGDMTLASIIILEDEIKAATSETGKLYFTVYSPGYFEFSEVDLDIDEIINGSLPFMADYSNPVIVDPYTLDEDFDNSLRVQKLYAGKPVQVTVKISSINSSYDGTYYIVGSDYQSKGGYKSYYLFIYMDESALDQLADFKRDQTITVCGFVDTSSYSAQLVHAIIIDK